MADGGICCIEFEFCTDAAGAAGGTGGVGLEFIMPAAESAGDVDGTAVGEAISELCPGELCPDGL